MSANQEIIDQNNGLNVIVSRIGPFGEPHGITKLPVGTKVVYTNDYGVSWPNRTIIRTGTDEYGDQYFLEPSIGSDRYCPPCRRRNLTIQGGVTD